MFVSYRWNWAQQRPLLFCDRNFVGSADLTFILPLPEDVTRWLCGTLHISENGVFELFWWRFQRGGSARKSSSLRLRILSVRSICTISKWWLKCLLHFRWRFWNAIITTLIENLLLFQIGHILKLGIIFLNPALHHLSLFIPTLLLKYDMTNILTHHRRYLSARRLLRFVAFRALWGIDEKVMLWPFSFILVVYVFGCIEGWWFVVERTFWLSFWVKCSLNKEKVLLADRNFRWALYFSNLRWDLIWWRYIPF